MRITQSIKYSRILSIIESCSYSDHHLFVMRIQIIYAYLDAHIIPITQIIMIAVRIIMIDHYEYACGWRNYIIIVNVFILLLEFMMYGNEG